MPGGVFDLEARPSTRTACLTSIKDRIDLGKHNVHDRGIHRIKGSIDE